MLVGQLQEKKMLHVVEKTKRLKKARLKHTLELFAYS